MNHRVLFFLSVAVIATGVVGIFRGGADDSPKSAVAVVNTKFITIAEALRDLNPYDIIDANDYRLRTIEVDKDSDDERDIRAIGASNLNGFLVRNHLAKNSGIIAKSVESPMSKTFLTNSLRKDELPYSYQVTPQEEHLLSSLSIGDKVVLYIRVIDMNKMRGSNDALMQLQEGGGGNGSGSSMYKYALGRITSPLSIINIQRVEKKDNDHSFDDKKDVGKIILRMNQKQLADLRVVENTGEILLFPAESSMANKKKIKTDEVLPQFKEVKELRGGK
ncbi:pilus assembly protein CpaB [Pectobacterium sp. CHL-2024]|uniref:pilus assembly protein CpaB n=1 Tax=Pectobacterium TaxID=122277 RepID=UPI000C1B8E1A|nr:pilus assembly protein CpaB [Pectobacterium brasiliense]ATV44429.1 pilus assembly protein CpaB [Pectobacterium brasiliense]MBA0210494.1 pilus assembly protein CpaB [Pectobacterium brasiliense]MCA6982385.1 pilus assembly protein CpaB [Pectobacterium brasiliense]MCH4991945.1 pilus assembly protein CpaB [Pectobacterium brasiliense]